MAPVDTMPKISPLTAFLIAVSQSDATDRVYTALVRSVDEAMTAVALREPIGAEDRHVGTLGAATVKRIKLKTGEVREIQPTASLG